jgi:ATP-dependent Lon protease
VGGIKEKVLAAKRAGIDCVLLPELNQRDLDDIPEPARKALRFEFLKTVDDALALALLPPEAQTGPGTDRPASSPAGAEERAVMSPLSKE